MFWPPSPGPPKLDLLIQIYGLTRKEAEIAVSLSEAKSIEQAAGQLGITYQTARTHLRHIFSKTGTSRQTELLLLLARLPGRHAGERNSLGPIVGTGGVASGSHITPVFPTTAGDLTWTVGQTLGASTFTAVTTPEPSSVVLLGFGLAAVGVGRRFRRPR